MRKKKPTKRQPVMDELTKDCITLEKEACDVVSSKDYDEEPQEVIHRQCVELDEWREKYRLLDVDFKELSKKYDEQLEGTSSLVAECNVWRKKFRDVVDKCKALETEKANAEEKLAGFVPLQTYDCLSEKYDNVLEESDAMRRELNELREKNADNLNVIKIQNNRYNKLLKKTNSLLKEIEDRKAEQDGVMKSLSAAEEVRDKNSEELRSANHLVSQLREENKRIEEELKNQDKKTKDAIDAVNKARDNASVLESSNALMEKELKRMKASYESLSKKCSEALADNKRMHNQSLWQRIFNR